MFFQLIILRFIRIPDKANNFWPSVGVRINEVLLNKQETGIIGQHCISRNLFVFMDNKCEIMKCLYNLTIQ